MADFVAGPLPLYAGRLLLHPEKESTAVIVANQAPRPSCRAWRGQATESCKEGLRTATGFGFRTRESHVDVVGMSGNVPDE